MSTASSGGFFSFPEKRNGRVGVSRSDSVRLYIVGYEDGQEQGTFKPYLQTDFCRLTRCQRSQLNLHGDLLYRMILALGSHCLSSSRPAREPNHCNSGQVPGFQHVGAKAGGHWCALSEFSSNDGCGSPQNCQSLSCVPRRSSPGQDTDCASC